MTDVVYVGAIEGRQGIKVGYSSNAAQRAKAIGQDAGEPFTLLHTEPVDDPKAVENAAHWELRAKHIQHEWFDVTLDEAMAAISIAVANVAAGIHPPTRIGHSKPFADEPKDVRVQLAMSADELAALDRWRAPLRIWSRSEAIRRLIRDGIARE